MTPMNLIGQTTDALDTPVLLVDLDVLESNIQRMSDTIIHEAGVNWRPHTKGMKTPALAHMLLRAGAIGVTCAKLGEAEVMAAAGIRDILVANQVVGPQKAARLAHLRRHADVMVAVDSLANVEELDGAALEAGVQLRVVIEVDVGMERAGVQSGEEALALARQIARREGLHFAGVFTWEAMALKIQDEEEKRRVIAAGLKQLNDAAQLCRDAGLPVDIVSCGGSGTYWISAFEPGVTEIQAGGANLGDVNYGANFGVSLPTSMSVLTTVTSRPTPTRIICDAGRKTMAVGSSDSEPLGIADVERVWLSAEHGIVELTKPHERPVVGEKIEFVPGYADVTVALHDDIFGIRNGVIETIWPLLGRGKLQ